MATAFPLINGRIADWIDVGFAADAQLPLVPPVRVYVFPTWAWRELRSVRTWTERRAGDIVRVTVLETIAASAGKDPHDLEQLAAAGTKTMLLIGYGDEDHYMVATTSGRFERSELRSLLESHDVIRMRNVSVVDAPLGEAGVYFDVKPSCDRGLVHRVSTFVGSYEPFALVPVAP